jgi:hypothetical protein
MESPWDGEVGPRPEHNMTLIMKFMALTSKLSIVFLNLLKSLTTPSHREIEK